MEIVMQRLDHLAPRPPWSAIFVVVCCVSDWVSFFRVVSLRRTQHWKIGEDHSMGEKTPISIATRLCDFDCRFVCYPPSNSILRPATSSSLSHNKNRVPPYTPPPSIPQYHTPVIRRIQPSQTKNVIRYARVEGGSRIWG